MKRSFMPSRRRVLATVLAVAALAALTAISSPAHADNFGGTSKTKNPPPELPCGECDTPGNPPTGAGEPINPFRGEWYYSHVDLEVPGVFPIRLERRHDGSTQYFSPLGFGWAFTYDWQLYEFADGSVVVRNAAGKRHLYTPDEIGGFVSEDGTVGWRQALRVNPAVPGGYILTEVGGTKRLFDADGLMTDIVNPQGHSLHFEYEATPTGMVGAASFSIDPERTITVARIRRLTSISERTVSQPAGTGRQVTFTYNANTRLLQTATSHDGRSVTYAHDPKPSNDAASSVFSRGNLVSVTLPTGIVQTYVYNNMTTGLSPNHLVTDFEHVVTSFTDGQGVAPVVNTYDWDANVPRSGGRIERQVQGGLTIDMIYEPVASAFNETDDWVGGQENPNEPSCADVPCTVVNRTSTFESETAVVAKTAYKYSPLGYPLVVIDAVGNKTINVYETAPGRTSFLDRQEIYRNTNGSLSNPVRALQKTIEFSYDADGNQTLRQVTLDSGEVVEEEQTFDGGWLASRKLTSTLSSQEFLTEYTFFRENNADPESQPINIKEIKKKRGAGFEVTTFAYEDTEGRGQLTRITPPAVTPADDLSIVRVYNTVGDGDVGMLKEIRLETSSGAIPQLKRTFTYESQTPSTVGSGFLASVTDARNNTTTFVWDDLGRLTSTTNPLLETSLFGYAAPGSTTTPGRFLFRIERGNTTADGEGQVQRLTWSNMGFLEKIQRKNAAGTLEDFEVYANDSAGNRRRVKDGSNHVETFHYDLMDRLQQVREYTTTWTSGTLPPLYRTTAFAYDAVGNRIRVREDVGGLNRATEFIHDDLDRLMKIIQPGSLETEFTHDAAGNVRKVTDPKEQETIYEYDDVSRLTSVVQELGQTVSYTYDGRGRLQTLTNARDHVLTHSYFAWGGLQSVFHDLPGTADDRTLSYAYDASGNLRSTVDSAQPSGIGASGSELLGDRLYSLTYDAIDRVSDVEAHYGPGTTLAALGSDYDRFGNRDALDLVDGAGTAAHAWSYDSDFNRLTQVTLPGGATPTLALTYFGNDDLDTLTHGNGLITEVDYHPYGPVQQMSIGSGPLHRLVYTYDKILNVDTITETIAGTAQSPAYDYGYDDLERLTAATYPSGLGLPSGTPGESFSYDTASNREVSNPASYDYDANNRLTVSPFSPLHCYDDDGNLTSTRSAGDCTSGTETQTFTWDAISRLSRYQNPGSSQDVAYAYDPFGRRIRKTDGSASTWYVWDGDHLLGEYDNSGIRQVRYAYARGFAPVQVAYKDGSGEDVYDVHSDHLDTPKMLTDAADVPVWRAAHEAFGKASVSTDPDGSVVTPDPQIPFNIRFPGQYYDAESGLHYNRFRYYDAGTGRYVSADPIGQAGGANVFAYPLNPTVAIDPLGLRAIVKGGSLDTVNFVGNYAVGTPVDLGSVGLGDAFETSASVRGQVADFDALLAQQAADAAQQACDGCPKGGVKSSSFSSSSPGSTNVTNEPGLYSVGRSSFSRSGSCTVTVDCDTGAYSYACNTSFGINDAFTDPFRFGETFGGNGWNPPGSKPYPITHSFSRGTRGGGSLK